MATRLQSLYRSEIAPALKDEFGRSNIMAVPKLEKICLNMGVGKALDDNKMLEEASQTMTMIAGQASAITRARISVSNFRLRQGYRIGCRVTLRGDRMYEFLDRLVTIALPRVRDFRGLNGKAFDGQGNYNMGLKEQIIFPEIEYDQVDKVRGMDITICTTAKTDEEARALLEGFEFPFVKA